ncbi:MAG TPA: chlorohydrolase, partial [Anaerolineae bacterium]|nr:chlorohydrolase [Anaerolineae bacterium]
MLITNARVATLGPEPRLIEDGALYLDGDKIVAVDTTAALRARYPEAERFDAGGQLALPAPLCAHTHFYGAFARGWAYPGPAATRFGEILERLWWRLDKLLTPED